MKNLSNIYGIVDFNSPDGLRYRAEQKSGGMYEIQVFCDGSWKYWGRRLFLGKCTPAKVWDEIETVKNNCLKEL